eukprot:8905317-Pyramimonas_sp.AAC.1
MRRGERVEQEDGEEESRRIRAGASGAGGSYPDLDYLPRICKPLRTVSGLDQQTDISAHVGGRSLVLGWGPCHSRLSLPPSALLAPGWQRRARPDQRPR